jgi:hypothetical protein
MLQYPTLKDRIFRSHKSIHLLAPTQMQRGTYKGWTDDSQMEEVAGGTSVRRAALDIMCQSFLLVTALADERCQELRSGPPPYLNAMEALSRCVSIEYGKSRKEVLSSVNSVWTVEDCG